MISLATGRCQSASHCVGKSVAKPDAFNKAKGLAKYVGDISREGLLVGKFLRSPLSHARILSIDTSKAWEYPGVESVFTAKDIPGKNCFGYSSWKDQPFLADEKVMFCGEAVALVAAKDEKTAAAAVKLIEVRYEPLRIIADPEEALTEGAPLLHRQSNLCSFARVCRGDAEAAIKKAAVVVTRTYRTQFVDHAYIEPNGSFAEWCGNQLQVWTTTKSAFKDRNDVAELLGMDPEKVRVIAAVVGGSFGGKSDFPVICGAALITYHTGKPARIVYTREEDLQVTSKRHPYTIVYTHAASEEGKLLAVKMDLLADAGAYSSYTPTVVTRAVVHGTGPYEVEDILLEGRSVFTNNPSGGAMRGYGIPQICFAYESQMDLLAQELGMDPLELRLKNAMKTGSTMPTGQKLNSCNYIKALTRAKEFMAENPLKPPPKSYIKRGWGLAGFYYGNGRTAQLNPGTARVVLNRDGLATAYIGSPDVGQGSDTIFAQIAAEVLGLDFGRVKVVSADTNLTTDSGSTSGTRLTYVVGRGVEMAALSLRDIIMAVLANIYEKQAEDIWFQGDTLLCRLEDGTERDLTIRRLMDEAKALSLELAAAACFNPPTTALDPETGQGDPYGAYTFGVQCFQVEVNTFTGKVTPLLAGAFYDVGRVINPQLYTAQLEGGIVGGLGYVLLEKIELNRGKVKNNNFDAYLIPTSLDICPMVCESVESFEPTGPLGAKGVGEPAIIPTAPAVTGAIRKALDIEVYELPVVPEFIIRSLCDKESKGEQA